VRIPTIGTLCLAVAACISSKPKSVAAPVARAVSEAPPQPVASQQPQDTVSVANTDAPKSTPLDVSARLYGYPPGTILRFSRSVPLAVPRQLSPTQGAFRSPPYLTLLVFRWCSQEGVCREQLALREAGASSLALTAVPTFVPDTGQVE